MSTTMTITQQDLRQLVDLIDEATGGLAVVLSNQAEAAQLNLDIWNLAPQEVQEHPSHREIAVLLQARAAHLTFKAAQLRERPQTAVSIEMRLVPMDTLMAGSDVPPMAHAAAIGTHHRVIGLAIAFA